MMGMKKKDMTELDWELTDEFYSQDTEEKELKLEDFIDETSADLNTENGLNDAVQDHERLQQTAADVARVLALSGQGKTAPEIADEMGMELSCVSDIMVCIQAFPEDDPLAVARLMIMG